MGGDHSQLYKRLDLYEKQLKEHRSNKQSIDDLKKQLWNVLSSEFKPIKHQGKNVSFFGKTSSGKSSLLKKLLGCNLKIGLGKCTTSISLVYSDEYVTVYDAPGCDDQFNIATDIATIARFFRNYPLDVVYVLYEGCIADVKDIFMSARAVKAKVYFVRTKCDNWDEDCELSIDQEMQRDYCEIQKNGFQDPQVFATSKKGGFDNQKLKQHLLMPLKVSQAFKKQKQKEKEEQELKEAQKLKYEQKLKQAQKLKEAQKLKYEQKVKQAQKLMQAQKLKYEQKVKQAQKLMQAQKLKYEQKLKQELVHTEQKQQQSSTQQK